MPRPQIIAHHLIWTLYGHWLPNDPRGSGSEQIEQEKLAVLGPIHRGRKPDHLQPSRRELRDFQTHAEPLLSFQRFWINDQRREILTSTFEETIQKRNYTVWACAILANHVHMVVRKHRDDALGIWDALADASRERLRELQQIGPRHPVWAERPYKVFLRTPEEVRARIRYVERNPEKEGLPPQRFDFVKTYDNWPFHKKK